MLPRMFRPRLAVALLAGALLAAGGCRSLLDNDELSFAGSGGGTTAGSGGDGAGGDGTGGGCCVDGEMRDCPCGCPSLFPGGALETMLDITQVGYDCNKEQSLIEEGTCHAMRFGVGTATPYCGSKPVLETTLAAEGSCVFSRFRARSDAAGAYILLGAEEGTRFLTILDENIGTSWTARDNECRVATPFEVERLFINMNSGGLDALLDVDYVEIFISPCSSPMVLDCPIE